MYFQEHLREKNSKFFPTRPVFLDEKFIEVPWFLVPLLLLLLLLLLQNPAS